MDPKQIFNRYPGGDAGSWIAGYWQLGLGILGTQTTTADLGSQAIGIGLTYPRYPGHDSRSWITGYWQLGLGTLGTQAATADPEFQAIGSWAYVS